MTHQQRWLASITMSVWLSVTSLVALPHAGHAVAPRRDHGTVEQVPALSGTGGERTGPRAASVRRHVSTAYGKLPLSFIENTGQADRRVKFYERAAGRTTWFTADGVYVDVFQPTSRTADSDAGTRRQVVKLAPVGMRQGVEVVPEGRQGGTVHYFIGNDPEQWRTNVATYSAVVYQEAYPGIDIRFYGNNRELEYDVVVKPGADPSAARFAYSGVEDIAIGQGGELRVMLPGGAVLEQRKPVIYQEAEGKRVEVEGGYRLYGQYAYGFAVGPYDRGRALIIDPVLMFAYSTYLGGAGWDEGYSIAVDAAGQAYVTGWTYSPDFPTTGGAFDTTHNGMADAFITKLSAAGRALLYSTYLGGSYGDAGYSIAVDASLNVYVAGQTISSDFPTTSGAFDATHNGGWDTFITKLSADGRALVYSTFLGGREGDYGFSMAVDAAGQAYVTGYTLSPDFPTTAGAFDPICGTDGYCNSNPLFDANYDVFVTKLDAAGRALLYSTYLGGAGQDGGTSMAVDAAGQAYVTGWTYSPDFPTTLGAFDRTCGTDGNCNPIEGYTSSDVLITKLDAAGRALLYSTYLGGQFSEEGTSMAVDAAGQAYLLGNTMSDDFPITPGALDETRNDCPLLEFINCHEPFITKLDAAGSALVYSTYLGPFTTRGYGIALDAARNVYVTGSTFDDVTLPTTPGALDPTYNGEGDAFVSKISEMAQ